MMRLRKPSWLAVALLIAGLALFVALGIWQLQRGAFKQDLLDRFAASSIAPTQPFADAAANRPTETVYPHVRVDGQFLSDQVYVLDNQRRNGRSGVLVFVPLLPQSACRDSNCKSARALLVNLGFLPRLPGPRSLPDLPPMAQGKVELTGLYAPPPGSGLRLGGNPLPRQSDWPKSTTWIDLDQIGEDLGRTLYPRVLLLDPEVDTPFVRSWAPETMPPVRHYGYAFQWFAFAFAALIIFYILHRPRRNKNPDAEP